MSELNGEHLPPRQSEEMTSPTPTMTDSLSVITTAMEVCTMELRDPSPLNVLSIITSVMEERTMDTHTPSPLNVLGAIPSLPPPLQMDNTTNSSPPSSPSSPTSPSLPPASLLSPPINPDKCHNPPCFNHAYIICATCNEAPSLSTDPLLAQYCSPDCQKLCAASYTLHCSKMQDRQLLFRVMRFAQRMFYIYREMTWHAFDVEGVEKMVKDGEEGLVLKGLVVGGDHDWPECYRLFPHHLLPNINDKEALLSFFACEEAMVWANEWIHGLLSEIVVEITQVIHDVKYVKRMMVLDQSDHDLAATLNALENIDTTQAILNGEIDDGVLPEREKNIIWQDKDCIVLKVTLRSGEEYVVDLAGAQYGYFREPVVDWEEYQNNTTDPLTAHTFPSPAPLSTISPTDYRVSRRVRLYHEILLSSDKVSKDLLTRHLESLNLYLMEWQFDGQYALEKLWKEPDSVFRGKVENLADFVDYRFCRFSKMNLTAKGRVLARWMRLRSGRWVFV